ncbi:MAG: aldehyde dehydrogenase family protein [Blastocatellia bacterium]
MARYQERHIRVRNPRTGEIDEEIVAASPERIGEIAARLRANQPEWRDAGLEHRVEAMRLWKASLAGHRQAIAEALTRDTGRRVLSFLEIDGLGPSIDRWCGQARLLLAEPPLQPSSISGLGFKTQFVPYPLVGAITPWNFPVTLSMIDAIPALIAGCGVIVKPSEVAPRFIAPLQASIDAVPDLAAVLRLIAGDGATGASVVEAADLVCFTGGVRTGRIVAAAAARRLIPAFLELGGKDPAIVAASADPGEAARAILRASVLATGQACQSLERIYVHESIHAIFVDSLVRQARAVTLNYPHLHEGQIGPLIFEKQADIIEGQLRDAVSKGARVLCGGAIEAHGGGRWIHPTVLVDVDHSMKIMTDESFGPIMPVMAYRAAGEAIALANDSIYGLSAAVFAGSLDEAESIARRLDAGAVSINDAALTGLMHDAEKNAFKLSGLGSSRMGAAGLMRFFRKKALIFQTHPPLSIQDFGESGFSG